MRWDYGTIYKKIRKSKHISQEEVCQDYTSRAHLSRIESNQVVPSFELMEHLLKQVGLDFEEFRYICHSYHHSDREEIILLAEDNNAYQSNDKLLELKNKSVAYLRKHPNDIPVSNILKRVEVILCLRESGPNEKVRIMATEAWNEIKNQDVWYHSDLKLIVVILFTLPLETVISICDEVIDRLNDYSDYTEILPTKYKLLSNLASIFLWNGLMEKCTSISYLLLDTAKKSKRYDFLGNAKVTLGICLSDKKLVDEGLQLLELTDEITLLEACRSDVKRYFKD